MHMRYEYYKRWERERKTEIEWNKTQKKKTQHTLCADLNFVADHFYVFPEF